MPHTITSPTPSSPNPQNGHANPYGYNPNTYTIGNGINGLGGGYVTSPANGHGNITVAGSGPYGAITISPPRQIMTLKWIGDALQTILTGEENNQFVNLELTPERDITPLEQLRITLLITSISSGGLPSCTALMSYVRQHHLERHFKFSVA
jgi:hypothetical protein